MQNNNPNDYLQEEIYLKDIIKLLINSKKLIIVTTLIITLLGAIYSFQKAPLPLYKSTALIEIGKYYQDQAEQILIEPTKTLIKELTIYFIHKQQENLSINSIENTLINIYSTSVDPAKNIDLLNKVIQYIENRHSLLLSENTQRITNQLTYEIESLNDQIEFSNKVLLTQNEDEKLRIANEIESLNDQIEFSDKVLFTQNENEKFIINNKIIVLNNELLTIDLKIKALDKVILEDENNLKLLESNTELFLQRAAQYPTLNQVVHSYNNQLLDLEAEITSLSLEKGNLESQLKLLESDNLESEIVFQFSEEIDSLQSQLKLLESKDQKSVKVFNLSQEKDRLELELEFLLAQNPTSTHLIGEIENTINLKKDLTIFLSFILGLFLSIMLVFINNFYKAFKEG